MDDIRATVLSHIHGGPPVFADNPWPLKELGPAAEQALQELRAEGLVLTDDDGQLYVGPRYISQLVEQFLAQRVRNDGQGYTPVQQEDLRALELLADLLIGAKWAPDVDGDYPVEVRFADRNRQLALPYADIPYYHRGDPRGRALRALVSNTRMLVEQLGHYADNFEELERRTQAAAGEQKRDGGDES